MAWSCKIITKNCISDAGYTSSYILFHWVTFLCISYSNMILFMITYIIVHHMPKCMSCQKSIMVITRRAHCFHDYIYIIPILLLWAFCTLGVDNTFDHLYIYIYIYIYIHPSIHPPIYLSIYLSIYLRICQFIYLSIYVFIYMYWLGGWFFSVHLTRGLAALLSHIALFHFIFFL